MSSEELSPEESAELAVDGIVRTDHAVYVESSTNPDDLPVGDWLNIQRLHQQGDENGLLKAAREIRRAALGIRRMSSERPDTTGLREVCGDPGPLAGHDCHRDPGHDGEHEAMTERAVIQWSKVAKVKPPPHIDTTPMSACPSDGRPCPYSCEGEAVCATPEPDAGDVETLARFLHNEGDGGIWEHFGKTNARTVADAILASDWLANHVRAAVETETADLREHAIECERVGMDALEARALLELQIKQWASQHEQVMDDRVPMTDRDERESGRKLVRRLRSTIARADRNPNGGAS